MDRIIIKDNLEFTEQVSGLCETLFHNANGYIGVRGCLEEGVPSNFDTMRGIYINGFYDIVPMKQAENLCNFVEEKQTMLNVVDTQTIYLKIDGEEFSLNQGVVKQNKRILNMDEGYTAREIVWCSPTGKEVYIYVKRMTSFVELSLFIIEYSVTPINFSGDITFVSYHNPNVFNYSNPNDPRLAARSEHYLHVQNIKIENDISIAVSKTTKSNLSMCSAVKHLFHGEGSSAIKIVDNRAVYEATLQAKANQTTTLTKYTVITDSIREKDLRTAALEIVKCVQEKTSEYYYAKQKKYLEVFWKQTEMQILGDEEMNQAVCFNMYQLLQSVAKDSHCNIAAKGMSGEGYEGHYFWDTEMFIMPFFTLTYPEISKSLLSYRYDILDKAKENAKLLGHENGALYPWRTINGVECSGYYPSGTAQYHINGDIAYAIINYYLITGDFDFIADKGAEILLETGRLWLDVGNYSDGKFIINTVTGPDEYTCMVNNNFYTNCVAKYHLEWAVKFYNMLCECGKQSSLVKKINLKSDEIEEMSKAANAMYLVYDEEAGINPQDDSFLSKPVWDIAGTPKEKFPLLLHYHPLHLYRYQVCKQADTILAYFLFEEEQEYDVMRKSYEYYEKITTHDSSLSKCVFSIVASRLGMKEKAYEYYGDSAKIDLENLHNNTKDGIHTANMGGCYMAIVNGFGGLRITEKSVSLAPFLPEKWEGYSFKFGYKNNRIKVLITKETVEITLEEGKNLDLIVYGKEYRLTKEKLTVSME